MRDRCRLIIYPSETSFLTAAYLILRKDGSLLISLLAMMLSTGMPELQAEADLEYMRTQLQLDQSSEEQVLKFLSFIFLYFYIFIFIGPESDHWECLSLTHSLTNSLTPSCLVNLIDVTLACEDAYSKLVEVVTVADVSDEDRVGISLFQIRKLRFGHKA